MVRKAATHAWIAQEKRKRFLRSRGIGFAELGGHIYITHKSKSRLK